MQTSQTRTLSSGVSFSDPDLAWARHQVRPHKAGDNLPPVHGRTTSLLAPHGDVGGYRGGFGCGRCGLGRSGGGSHADHDGLRSDKGGAASRQQRRHAGGGSDLLGVQSPSELLGFSRPSGSETLPFGTVHWTSTGKGHRVASLAAAEASTGLSVALPSTLPNGIGSANGYFVVPKMTATVLLGPSAGPALSGSSLVATLGPGIGVTYAGIVGIANVYPLGILTVARPFATSTGATTAELEKFLLSQPEIPPDLAQELQLLGNLKTTLPVPTPRGASSTSIEVSGYPAVLLSDKQDDASAAVWEGAGGRVHIVAGLLDKEDLRGVAEQIR